MLKLPSIEEARIAKDEAKRQLAQSPGVVGVGLTKIGGGYAVKVNVDVAFGTNVPSHLGHVPVVVEFVGNITKRLSTR